MPLSEKEEHLLSYVEQYMQHAEACCALLRQASGLDFTRISRSERQAALSSKGKVKGLRYSFHGRGCFFKKKGLTIDVDFDMTGGCNAVDEWRMRLFLEDNYPLESYWPRHLPEGLARLVHEQRLHQVLRERDQHFYYLGAAPHVELV